jgi:rRNA maturation endonuclease Nob1
MSLPPSDRLDYFGNVSLNPNLVDIVAEPNIISSTSRIDADIEIEIPLEFTATNLTLKDTIDDIDIDDADKIMNAAIVITAENGYPLDVTIENIQLTDESYIVIDEIKDNEVIDAASVYTSGANIGIVNPESIQKVSHEIKLTQTQIANLNLTKNIIINAVVSTQNGGIPVKLKGDYELKFTISVQAQLDLSN